MMTSYKIGRVLLVIEKCMIYGISPDGGEVLFEIKTKTFEIVSVIDVIEGCLLCIDSKGQFRLIEIFYETGQVLATWHLNFTDKTVQWTIENAEIYRNSPDKFNLIIKMRNALIGRVILVYSLDPQSEIVSCTFRHWIINNYNDKSLPFIVRKDY